MNIKFATTEQRKEWAKKSWKKKHAKYIAEFFTKCTQPSPDSCWEWKQSISELGYGKAKFQTKSIGAHRLAYKFAKGEIPKGLYVCHACDNRKCINPAHLFLGTQRDNVQDSVRKGRRRYAFGDTAGGRKITSAVVIRIKERAKTERTYAKMASDYGISRRQICRIVRGKSWRHITAQSDTTDRSV